MKLLSKPVKEMVSFSVIRSWCLALKSSTKGFGRPVRRTYIHTICGVATTMGQAIAETYARRPGFYGATWCMGCSKHLPVWEFRWADDGQVVGS